MDKLRAIPESHPLHRLFRGLTEYAFMNELGIGDPSLVGYVAGMLANFVPSEALWRVRDPVYDRVPCPVSQRDLHGPAWSRHPRSVWATA